ncbi:hypothetical protein ACTA71_007945 [Dictyostelium dimigraforme]
MKQIFIILLLSFAFNNINAFLIQENSLKNVEINGQVCFPSGSIGIDGFYTNTIGVGDNGYFRTLPGEEQFYSYFEQSNLDIDFLNQRSYVYYVINNEGETSYFKSWAFTSNKTEYFATAVNNVQVCFSATMDYEISSDFKLVYSTDCKIGTAPCEVFSVYSPQSTNTNTSESIMVNKNDCSLMTSITRNIPPASPGMSLTNYLNFVPKSNPYNYALPSACLNPTPFNENMFNKHLIRPKLFNLFSNN